MKNITVSVPDEVYRKARIRAAEQGRSLSSLVAEFLCELSDRDSEFERLAALEEELISRITGFSGADRLSRDELYDRALR